MRTAKLYICVAFQVETNLISYKNTKNQQHAFDIVIGIPDTRDGR